ncbi:MAG: hypothetical protein ACREOF_16570, partial [Gemmatimonadales bacterium]
RGAPGDAGPRRGVARERRMTGGEPAPMTVGGWLDRHAAAAPEALRARVRYYAASIDERSDVPAALAAAGDAALEGVLAHPGDRSVALDLLAADALVTLGLLAQAQSAPERLGAFADGLLRMHLPTR